MFALDIVVDDDSDADGVVAGEKAITALSVWLLLQRSRIRPNKTDVVGFIV